MTAPPRSVAVILQDRLTTIQSIAEANTEQLRLTQQARGMMVLEMKDDSDGVTDPAHTAAQARNLAALDDTLTRINRLEQQLSSLDDELAAAMQKDAQ